MNQRFQIVLVQDGEQRLEPPTILASQTASTQSASSPAPSIAQQLETATVDDAHVLTPAVEANSVTPKESALGPDQDPNLDPGGKRAFQAMTDAEPIVEQGSVWSDGEAMLRTWTDLRGKFSVRAKLIKQTKRSVTLERADNGKQITILIRRLSKADQVYLAARVDQLTKVSAADEPNPNSKNTLVGRVVRVSDGDTIDIVDPNVGEQRIRLEGIDAPEYTQPYGREARQWLASQIAGKSIRVEVVGKDRYDRWAGHIYIGDRWINGLLVSHGWAWHYHHFSDDPRLATAQRQARASRTGLWQDPKPIAPWQYREQQEATVGFEPTNR